MAETEAPQKPAAKAKDPTQKDMLTELLALQKDSAEKIEAIEKKVNGLYVVEAGELAGTLEDKIDELKTLTAQMQNGARLQLDEESVAQLAGAFRADMVRAISEGDFVSQIASGVREKVAATTAKKVVEEVRAKTGDKGTRIAIWVAAAGVVTIIAAGAYAVAGYEPPVVDGVAVNTGPTTPANAA